MIFPLAEWEFFRAPMNADGDMAEIRVIETDEAAHRVYGHGVDGVDPGRPVHHVWLDPRMAPSRVGRRDPTIPMHPLEQRAMIKRGQAAIDQGDEDKVAARLAAIPEPEVRARPATLEECPRTLVQLGHKAFLARFDLRLTYSRGPRLSADWHVQEISDDVMLKGQHADGRRFVITYITKTPGEGAKGAGVPVYKPDIGYAMENGIWVACGPRALERYFTNGSLA